MKHCLVVICIACLLVSCVEKRVRLSFDNMTGRDITVRCFRDGQLFSVQRKKYTGIADDNTIVEIPLKSEQPVLFLFFNETMQCADSCMVYPDSIKKRAAIVVSSNISVLRKGDDYSGNIRATDSAMKSFFCGVYY